MNKAVIMICRGALNVDQKIEFNFIDDEDFKISLLKRLGNISTSKSLEDKRKVVKEIIYKNKDIRTLEKEIYLQSDWNIKIKLYMKEVLWNDYSRWRIR